MAGVSADDSEHVEDRTQTDGWELVHLNLIWDINFY